MNNSTKEQIGCDVICKSHSTRTERDLYRICPSKLSKRELEDLYFALLENNLNLKKNINVLQDKIKVLSTRLQRMSSVQKNIGKEKDCCASKSVINEHKENISDLKKANERMAERIRMLNMRLCSAKQFLKRSPSQAANCYKTCTRCSFKNSSLSALNAKQSDTNLKTTAVSCQFLDKDATPRTARTVETETEVPEKEGAEMTCNENKCRTMMDELKEKIVNLQEELSTSHREYSERIAKLESQVLELHNENLQVRSEQVTSEHALQQRMEKADQLQEKLGTADAKYNELNMELSIEKRKVAELETGLKLANLSNHVLGTIEQLAATKEAKGPAPLVRDQSQCSSCSQKTVEPTPYKVVSIYSLSPSTKEDTKILNEDSGCTDLNKSCEIDNDQPMLKINQELVQKIADLQTKLDLLRIAAAGNTVASIQQVKSKDFESYDVETKDFDETRNNTVASIQQVKSKDFESYDVENKDFDETRNNNAQDLGSMIMEVEPNVERNISVTQKPVAECDVGTTDQTDDDAQSVKHWEEFTTNNRAEDPGYNEEIDIKNQKSVSSITLKNKSDTKIAREDNDNRYQIPGPIPTAYPTSKKKPIYKNNRDSNEKPKNKKGIPEEKTVKIFETSKDSYFYYDISKDTSSTEGHAIAGLEKYANDVETMKGTNEQKRIVSVTDVPKVGSIMTRDSIQINRKKLSTQSEESDDDLPMGEVKKEPIKFLKLDGTCTAPLEIANNLAQESQVQETYELCESRVTICRCPHVQRDAAEIRSCSGTLLVRVQPTTPALRQCACQLLTHTGSQVAPTPPNRRDSATYTADVPDTYTVQVDKYSRATSPANTEREISSMSDLPSEKDAKSPRLLSPGEEKGTMTYTDTGNNTDGYGSLSEGEMPTAAKAQTLSVGERLPVSSAEMEATLQSISDELARCRRMLLSQKSQEIDAVQTPVLPPEELEVHALRPSVANRRIVDTHSPSCVFTLHIGTLVLSDEALLITRDKSLVLRWKFYSQTAAMTRVHSGRVVTFDFITEYDLIFNDELLEYMKNSDMVIALCELDEKEAPIATCSLPLRDALLHANRCADMSLALVPYLPRGVADDEAKENAGEEIGVLDLWCSLRLDSSLLPTIHRAMHTLPPPSCWRGAVHRRSESVPADDDPSSERVSRDFALLARNARDFPSTTSQLETVSLRNVRKPSGLYDAEEYRTSQHERKMSSQTQKSIPSSDLGHVGQVGFQNNWAQLHRDSSGIVANEVPHRESLGIIANEVPANIKSTDEMKQALEKNVQRNNTTRLSKMDEDTSYIHSSFGSVKTMAAKHQLSKLRWPKSKWGNKIHMDSLHELKKDKGSSIAGSAKISMDRYVNDEENEPTLSKLNKINKFVGVPGLNKVVEASKKSVKYTDTLTPTEESQTDRISTTSDNGTQSIDITILWLALNEECEAMVNPNIQRLYVAYTFLGRRGADLETPFSLPKPKHYADKCYFNFKKTFHLNECDLPLLGHMSRCRAGGGASTDPRDCLVFTLVSEPPEDPLGLSSCEDIGYAYLYLGDVLAYSGDSGGYTEVVGIRGVRSGVCGVLAVRVDNLPMLRRCLTLHAHRDPPRMSRSSRTPSRHHSSMMPMFEAL